MTKKQEEWNMCGDWSKNDKQETIGWALIFFWGALVILAEVIGFSTNYSWWNGWSVFFTGFGVIVLVGMLIYLVKGKLGNATWNLIAGLILLAIGLGDFLNFEWIWIVILAIIGIAILRDALIKKKLK